MSSSSAAVTAETSGPDPGDRPGDVAAHAGVSSASGYDALRADIRRLSTMLGQTLVHHGGPELLELVEQVRRLSRSAVAGDEGGDAEVTRLLAGLDTGTAVALTRAFSPSTFPAGQHRRAAAPGARVRGWRAGRVPLRRLMERLAAATPTVLPRRGGGGAGPAELRPCYRAPHRILPAVGAGHPCATGGRTGWTGRHPTRSWLRWSSCSGRPTSCAPGKPPVAAGARAIGWYMSIWAAARVPDLLGAFEREVRAAGFITVPEQARPVHAGLLGRRRPDGNPNVTPAVTREVMELYSDRAIVIHTDLSTS